MTRHNDRRTEVAPDRPRLGPREHPNIDRPGAQPHPAMRAPRAVPPTAKARGRSSAGERTGA